MYNTLEKEKGMRIYNIQPTTPYRKTYGSMALKTNPTKPQTETVTVSPQFRGSGKGLLLGLGTGLVTGLLVVGGAAIAGAFMLPAAIGGAAVVATGAAGAAIGEKIEDKITKSKDEE